MTYENFMILTIILLSIIAGTLIGILISLRRLNKSFDNSTHMNREFCSLFLQENFDRWEDIRYKLYQLKESIPTHYISFDKGHGGKLYHKKEDKK